MSGVFLAPRILKEFEKKLLKIELFGLGFPKMLEILKKFNLGLGHATCGFHDWKLFDVWIRLAPQKQMKKRLCANNKCMKTRGPFFHLLFSSLDRSIDEITFWGPLFNH